MDISPLDTSLINKPPPKLKPNVIPTTAIVDAFSPMPKIFKNGFIITLMNFSTPINMLYDKHHLNHFSKNSLEFLHKKNKLKIIENNLSQFNVESLTLPEANIVLKKFYKIALLTIFLIEKLILKKNQQTLICQKI